MELLGSGEREASEERGRSGETGETQSVGDLSDDFGVTEQREVREKVCDRDPVGVAELEPERIRVDVVDHHSEGRAGELVDGRRWRAVVEATGGYVGE